VELGQGANINLIPTAVSEAVKKALLEKEELKQ